MSPRSVESPPATCKMVTADGTPLVETCVLLPVEFALKVETQPRVASFLNLLPQLAPRNPLPQPLLDHFRAPSFAPLAPPLGSLAPALNPLGPPLNRLMIPTPDDCIQVCATRIIPPQTRYLPFSGTVRTDNLPLVPGLPPLDVSIYLSFCAFLTPPFFHITLFLSSFHFVFLITFSSLIIFFPVVSYFTSFHILPHFFIAFFSFIIYSSLLPLIPLFLAAFLTLFLQPILP